MYMDDDDLLRFKKKMFYFFFYSSVCIKPKDLKEKTISFRFKYYFYKKITNKFKRAMST